MEWHWEIAASIAIAALGSGGLAGWLLAKESKAKLRGEADKLEGEAAIAEVNALALFRHQLDEVTAENIRLRTEFEAFRIEVDGKLRSRDSVIADLTAHVGKLETELERMGAEIPPRPWRNNYREDS